MSIQTDEILDGLKIAMEAELTGHNFYKNAAENISDTQGREVLKKMAQEEMEHFKYLRHQYKSVLDSGDYDFAKEFVKLNRDQEENPVFSQGIKDRVKDCHLEISVLTIGMKLELDAINYYLSCAEKAETPEAKQFFRELADWETIHFESFEWELNRLKEGYWQANDFIPM